MDKIEKIRQEIGRLRKEIKDDKDPLAPNQKAGYLFALADMESFLNTLLEEGASPCWKKVHTYTEELHEGDIEKMLLDLSVGKEGRRTKIALPDKVVDTLSEEPDKSLEEAAEKRYPSEKLKFDSAFGVFEFDKHKPERDAFKAGAEWALNQGVKATGTISPKGIIYDNNIGHRLFLERYHNGDKVEVQIRKIEENGK